MGSPLDLGRIRWFGLWLALAVVLIGLHTIAGDHHLQPQASSSNKAIALDLFVFATIPALVRCHLGDLVTARGGGHGHGSEPISMVVRPFSSCTVPSSQSLSPSQIEIKFPTKFLPHLRCRVQGFHKFVLLGIKSFSISTIWLIKDPELCQCMPFAQIFGADHLQSQRKCFLNIGGAGTVLLPPAPWRAYQEAAWRDVLATSMGTADLNHYLRLAEARWLRRRPLVEKALCDDFIAVLVVVLTRGYVRVPSVCCWGMRVFKDKFVILVVKLLYAYPLGQLYDFSF